LVDSYISTNGSYGGSNVLSNGAEEASGQIEVNSPSVVNGSLYPNSTPGLTPVPVPSDAVSEPDLSLYGTLTLPKGDYIYNNIVLGNGAQLIPSGGQVRIWFNSLNINGSAVAGATSNPEQLGFFSRTTASAITIDGSSGDSPSVYGVLFAPNVAVNVAGYTQVYGTLIGSSVLLNGAGVGIHFDEVLSEACASGGRPDLVHSSGAKNPNAVPTVVPYKRQPLVVAPNPVRGCVLVAYMLPVPADAQFEVYNLMGERVFSEDLGAQGAGQHMAQADLSLLASGIYFAVIEENEGAGFHSGGTFKLALVK
jgi:hypothetical protein